MQIPLESNEDWFVKTRSTLVKKLRCSAKDISEEHTPYARTISNLRTLNPELVALENEGNFQSTLGYKQVPICYPRRINQIKRELERQVQMLLTQPHRSRSVTSVLKILSLQIGRLTLDAHSDDDDYVDRMERNARRAYGEAWPRRSLPGKENREVVEIWEGLNKAVEGCSCFQCAWRFRDDSPCLELEEELALDGEEDFEFPLGSGTF